jgi:hypothetical protein
MKKCRISLILLIYCPKCNAIAPGPTLAPSRAPSRAPATSSLAPTTVADTLVHLIAVVEEGGPSAAALMASWSTFRSTWPDRPFCVLKVSGTCSDCEEGEIGKLLIPAEMALDPLVTSKQAMRDNGSQLQQSDWFDLCDLQLHASTTVALLMDLEPTFLDPPISVEASYNLFRTRIESAGLVYASAEPIGDQNYIEPFNRNFVF